MAELRHATAATRAGATSSPSKRDAEAASASSPLVSPPRVDGGKDGLRPHPRWSLPPPVRSLLALEDPRSPTASASYRILVAAIACFAFTALFSAPSVWTRLVSSWLPDRFLSYHIRYVSSRYQTRCLRSCCCWTLERAVPVLEGGDSAPLPQGKEAFTRATYSGKLIVHAM
jgi:hypothetical protein